MAELRTLAAGMSPDRYRLAVLFGIASIPVTVAVNVAVPPASFPQTSEAFPVLIACFVTGYSYRSREVASARAGAITGFVGGVPIILWQTAAGVNDWWGHPIVVEAVGDSLLLVVVTGGVAVVTVGVLSGIFLLVGVVAGSAGGWLNGRISSQ